MNQSKQNVLILSRCSKCLRKDLKSANRSRFLSNSPITLARTVQRSSPQYERLRQEERDLRAQRKPVIGSQRRRAALTSTPGLSFEQLPYQCFQEARKIIAENRSQTIHKIQQEWERKQRLEATLSEDNSNKQKTQHRIHSIERYIEELKLEADIYDPKVKMTFEDGLGDMNKPIYRHLADKKWREMKRPIVMQRVEQMKVIPDVLPHIDSTASVELRFPRLKVQPGETIDSRITQFAPSLNVQVFDAGSRFVTILFIDSDVPDVQNDTFTHRLHGMYTNIELDPTESLIRLNSPKHSKSVVFPWVPPHAQKGSSYHRLSVFVVQHQEGKQLDPEVLKEDFDRNDFSLRRFVTKNHVKPIGITMFRTQWDSGTKQIMEEYGLPGADIEYKRKPTEKLPYKKKDGARYRGFS